MQENHEKSYDSLAFLAKEMLEGNHANSVDNTEEEIYEEAIESILEDESVDISEMSDEEIEKILEAKFNSLSETILKIKKAGKAIGSLISVSGRAERAAKKAAKGEKKIADREKLAKAKETLKKQKALRRAQKMAKRAGKPVPLSYADAGIK